MHCPGLCIAPVRECDCLSVEKASEPQAVTGAPGGQKPRVKPSTSATAITDKCCLNRLPELTIALVSSPLISPLSHPSQMVNQRQINSVPWNYL